MADVVIIVSIRKRWRLTFFLDPTFQTSGVNNTVIDGTNCTGVNLAQNEIWTELEITP